MPLEQIPQPIDIDPNGLSPPEADGRTFAAFSIMAWLLYLTAMSPPAEPSEHGAGDGPKKASYEAVAQPDSAQKRAVNLDREQLGKHDKDHRIAVPITPLKYPDMQERYMILDAIPANVSEAPSFETVVVAYGLPQDAAAKLVELPGEMDRGASQAGTRDVMPELAEIGNDSDAGQAGTPFQANRDMVYLPNAQERLFDELDANNDEEISKDEAQAHPPLAEQFERIDTYANGRITRAEFARFEVAEGDPGPQDQDVPQ